MLTRLRTVGKGGGLIIGPTHNVQLDTPMENFWAMVQHDSGDTKQLTEEHIMAIKVGCFALIDPFSVLEHQLERIRDWGFKYADVTDSTDGGSMGVEYGFAAVASLDANPFDIKRMFEHTA